MGTMKKVAQPSLFRSNSPGSQNELIELGRILRTFVLQMRKFRGQEKLKSMSKPTVLAEVGLEYRFSPELLVTAPAVAWAAFCPRYSP